MQTPCNENDDACMLCTQCWSAERTANRQLKQDRHMGSVGAGHCTSSSLLSMCHNAVRERAFAMCNAHLAPRDHATPVVFSTQNAHRLGCSPQLTGSCRQGQLHIEGLTVSLLRPPGAGAFHQAPKLRRGSTLAHAFQQSTRRVQRSSVQRLGGRVNGAHPI